MRFRTLFLKTLNCFKFHLTSKTCFVETRLIVKNALLNLMTYWKNKLTKHFKAAVWSSLQQYVIQIWWNRSELSKIFAYQHKMIRCAWVKKVADLAKEFNLGIKTTDNSKINWSWYQRQLSVCVLLVESHQKHKKKKKKKKLTQFAALCCQRLAPLWHWFVFSS